MNMHFGFRILVISVGGAGLICLLVGMYSTGWLMYDIMAHPVGLKFDTLVKFRFGILNVTVCVTVVGNNTLCAKGPIEKAYLTVLEAFRKGNVDLSFCFQT